ncbi:RDD family protein [Chitinimonas sp.]|uniref:RDD family protein n=1 Tax=Chitinimonas sp. TaxID=1934313 RepID=UPI0035AE1F87
MSDNNIYAAPEAKLVNEAGSSNTASRWKRLWASLIDTITIAVITVPVGFFIGAFNGITTGQQPGLLTSLALALLGLIVFFAINYNFLVKNGQTVGKKVLGIKIVGINGEPVTFQQHLIKRYAAFMLPGQIPLIGPLINLVNILFIFGKEARCGHDHIAGTKVVDC